MTEFDQKSLRYLLSREVEGQWSQFLGALAEELNEQMSAADLRVFMFIIGKRMASANPLPAGQTIDDLEASANVWFGHCGWGWMQVRDLQSSLEFLHACAPLRQAFGEKAMEWAPGLLEGIYAEWLRQLGAGAELQLRQIGRPEGDSDLIRFRLARSGQFF